MGKRKYYSRLLKSFLRLGLLFVLIVSVITGFFVTASQRQQYLSTIKQSASARSSVANIGLSVIMTALKDVTQNSVIDKWGASVGNYRYYFNSIGAFQQIRNSTSGPSLVDFEISVSTLDENSFFITPTGTMGKDLYFKTGTSLTQSQVDGIYQHFRSSREAMALAAFTEDDRLKEIYYLTSRTCSNGYTDMLYIIKIPSSQLFGKEGDFVIFDGNGDFFAGCSRLPERMSRYTKIIASLNEEDDIQKIAGCDVFADTISVTGWKVLYIYDDIDFSGNVTMLLLCLMCLLLFLAVPLGARLLTRRLYAPIEDVLSDVAGRYVEGEGDLHVLDEFQILKSSSSLIQELSEELEAAISANNALIEQKRYRDLLLGARKPDSVKPPYCVALFELPDNEGQGGTSLDKNRIDAFTRRYPGLHYVNVSLETCAVILEGEAARSAMATVKTILRETGDPDDVRVALSDTAQSEASSISGCYHQALKILDYKYVYDRKEVITSGMVAQHEDETYYYPLATEVQLAKNLAQGREEAIESFRYLVRENIERRSLTSEAMKNFMFAIIGTVQRVFQEIKTTPEALLGHPIDFSAFYTRWNSAETLGKISRIIDGIVEAVQQRNENSDSNLMRDMLDYIHKNYQQDIMLNDMAEHFNISPKYCSALFKRLCNDTFKNHLNQFRVQAACDILSKQPQIKITQLSEQVGFNSSNSFIRVFSKYVGMTPKAYACQHSQDGCL